MNKLSVKDLSEKMKSIALDFYNNRPLVCAIVGGGGSGKSTLAALLESVDDGIISISVDDYVRGDRAYRRKHLEYGDPKNKYDFDLMNKTLDQIKTCSNAMDLLIPKYDETTGSAIDADKSMYRQIHCPVKVIFIEGVFAGFVQQPDLVFFLDLDEETRLKNRLARANTKRQDGNLEEVISNFKAREEKEYIPYALPHKEQANYIIKGSLLQNEYSYTITKQ